MAQVGQMNHRDGVREPFDPTIATIDKLRTRSSSPTWSRQQSYTSQQTAASSQPQHQIQESIVDMPSSVPAPSYIDLGTVKPEKDEYESGRHPVYTSPTSSTPASSMVSPSAMYPGPPPPYSTYPTPSRTSITAPSACASPPTSRRESREDKEHQVSGLSLPPFHEALEKVTYISPIHPPTHSQPLSQAPTSYPPPLTHSTPTPSNLRSQNIPRSYPESSHLPQPPTSYSSSSQYKTASNQPHYNLPKPPDRPGHREILNGHQPPSLPPPILSKSPRSILHVHTGPYPAPFLSAPHAASPTGPPPPQDQRQPRYSPHTQYARAPPQHQNHYAQTVSNPHKLLYSQAPASAPLPASTQLTRERPPPMQPQQLSQPLYQPNQPAYSYPPTGPGLSIPVSYDQHHHAPYPWAGPGMWRADNSEMEKVEELRRAAASKRANDAGNGKHSYGESVKRQLDNFDLETCVNEIAAGSGQILDFARRYSVAAHHNARLGPGAPGSLPELADCDDMICQQNRIIDAMFRIKDLVVNQQRELDEQRNKEQMAKTQAMVQGGHGDYAPGTPASRPVGIGLESDSGDAGDTSNRSVDGGGGFAGSDAKKRRGRNAQPGRCHSCNRAETPEWRRGPDGARTLCNACGLHYAKLTRKMGSKSSMSGTNLRPKEGEATSP